MDRDAAKDPGQLTLFDEPAHEAAPGGGSELRRALLDGRAVEFRFHRRRRRTLGLRVNELGLTVAAPLRTPWREVNHSFSATCQAVA